MAATVDDAIHVDQITKHQVVNLQAIGTNNEPRHPMVLGSPWERAARKTLDAAVRPDPPCVRIAYQGRPEGAGKTRL